MIHNIINPARRSLILSGDKFGFLTVVKEIELRRYKNGSSRRQFELICTCGNTVNRIMKSFRNSPNANCGCKGFSNLIHGMTGTPLWVRWDNMKQRCYNPKNTAYSDYGGRGITVCDEWRHSFMTFKKWALENGFSEELRIDRENNDEGYSPENCRFVSEEVNQNNKRSNVFFDYNGMQMTLPQIGRQVGIDYKVLWNRIMKQGLSIDEAVAAGDKKRHPRHKESMAKRCEALGVPYNSVKIRKFRFGLTEDDAIAYYLNKENIS